MPSIYDHRLAQLAYRTGSVSPAALQKCGRLLVELEHTGRPGNLGTLLVQQGCMDLPRLVTLERQLQLEGVQIPSERLPMVISEAEQRAAQLSWQQLGDITHALASTEMYCARCGDLIPDEMIDNARGDHNRKERFCSQCLHDGLQPSQVFHGFRIEAPLGAGRLGPVYRARDLERRVDVVLKHVTLDAFRGPREARLYQETAEALTALKHEHVAQIIRTGRVRRDVYVAFQLIDGQPLTAYAADAGLKDILRLMIDVADALQFLLLSGFFHGDIRPRKILIAPPGGACLLDAALPTWQFFPAAPPPGDAYYVAPELAEGRTMPNVHTDLYAAGMLLIELLCRRRVPVPEAFEVMTAAQMPRALVTLLQRLTDPKPARRQRMPADVQRELMRIALQV